jgi:two-component system cell cycle sensor histidine kinase/response regulator CckA
LTPEQSREGRWHQIVHEDDLPECLERWEQALRTGDPLEMELRFRRADGEHCWHLCRARAQKDASGKVVRWIGLCTDLDEQKKSEKALRQSAKLQSIGVLAGGVAHDFNNLLTGILGNISLAADLLPEEHEARDALEAALNESHRAADLIKQLLAYAGKSSVTIESIQLSRLIPELNTLFRTIIPNWVSLETHLQDPLPLIRGDRVQIQQILINLIINGAEAIEDGRAGKILVTTKAQEFAERYRGAYL